MCNNDVLASKLAKKAGCAEVAMIHDAFKYLLDETAAHVEQFKQANMKELESKLVDVLIDVYGAYHVPDKQDLSLTETTIEKTLNYSKKSKLSLDSKQISAAVTMLVSTDAWDKHITDRMSSEDIGLKAINVYSICLSKAIAASTEVVNNSIGDANKEFLRTVHAAIKKCGFSVNQGVNHISVDAEENSMYITATTCKPQYTVTYVIDNTCTHKVFTSPDEAKSEVKDVIVSLTKKMISDIFERSEQYGTTKC